MTKLEALTDLLAKVEAGKMTGSDLSLAATIGLSGQSAQFIGKAYHGSLDAAKALHEAVLPFRFGFETFSLSGEIVLKRDRPIDHFYGFADTNPARAWLIAILKALISMEKNDD